MTISDKEKKNPAYGRNIVSQPMQIEAPIQKKKHTIIFCHKHFFSNCRGYPRKREKYLTGALALLSGKFWLVQEFQIDLGIFYIKNYQNL